jgi:hypothetical protein
MRGDDPRGRRTRADREEFGLPFSKPPEERGASLGRFERVGLDPVASLALQLPIAPEELRALPAGERGDLRGTVRL